MWMRILCDIWIGSHQRQSRTDRCSMSFLWRVLRLWPKLLRFWWFPWKSKAWLSLGFPAEVRFTYFCRDLPLSLVSGLILLCTLCSFLWMVLMWCNTTVVFGIRYWLRPILRTLLHGNLHEFGDRIGKLTSRNSSLEENVSDTDCEGKVLE